MTLLLYAIAGCATSEVEGTGIDGAPLTALEHRGLAAIVSEEVEADEATTLDRLWQYERVMESLMERHPILPVRFGSRSADQAEVRSLLAERHRELSAALERVTGTVELAVTAQWRDPECRSAEERPGSGTAYMLARVELHRAAATVERQLDPLAAIARASRTGVLPRPAVAFRGSYLVEHARLAEFTATVSEQAAALDRVDVVCTGPWPPYSFVAGATG
jgi:hypothetical protein